MTDETSYKQPRTGGHTPEPWGVYSPDPIVIIDSEGGSLGEMSAGFPGVTDAEMFANAARVVACVNAWAGIPTAQLEAAPPGAGLALVEALGEMFKAVERHDLYSVHCCNGYMCGCQGASNADVLLYEMGGLLSHFTGGSNNGE